MNQPRHLFLSDVDGTLLRHDAPMTPELTAAAEAYRRAGGLVALCTGRSVCSARPVAQRLGVNAPSILYGGASIYDFSTEKHLFLRTFQGDILRSVAAVLERHPQVSMQVYTAGEIYLLRRNRRLDVHGVAEENVGPEVPLSTVQEPVMKLVMCCDDPTELERCRGYFPEDTCNFAFSSRTFADVVPAGFAKADTAAVLLRQLGISERCLFCAGDAVTDLPVLRMAACSFAPANAMEAVKAYVTCVVPPVTEGGMAEAFQKAAAMLQNQP